MRAVTRLCNVTGDFHDSWRAHSAALQSIILVKNVSAGGGELLKTTLSMSKGFETGFDATYKLNNLLEEIEYMQEFDFFALRKNCLLGVCSSFEEFAKSVAAILSYEPNWKDFPEGKRLLQEIESDFFVKYSLVDKDWKKGYAQFFKKYFPWLREGSEKHIVDIFWLRNQLTHNANSAKEDKTFSIGDVRFSKDEQITLNSELLSFCIRHLREVVNLISNGTPYLEAI